jgi:hypothetical protein
MADQYIPGLQMQNWASLPSLSESIMSGNFGKTPLGILTTVLLGSTYGKEKPEIQGAVIPEENKQSWESVPSTKMAIPPIGGIGLNPNLIGKLPMTNSVQLPNQSDINAVKQSLWE